MAVEVTKYVPSPTVKDFILDEHTIKLIMGPVGSGKSVGCLMNIARDCQTIPAGKDGIRRSRWAVIRNTNQQLMDTTFKSWQQWFPDGAAGRWMESKKTFFLRMGDVQAEIMFRPLDSAADLQRLLSLELTSAYFNELREIDKTIFEGVRTRIGRYPKRNDVPEFKASIISDTNPPDMDSWLYDMIEAPDEALQQVMAVFRQPGGLEPNAENLENLPKDYYQNMMAGASKDFIDVHVHGLYGRSNLGKPVHPSFDERLHTNGGYVPEHGVSIVLAFDFGLTPAMVMKQMDGWGRINTFDECWTTDMYLEQFLEKIVMPKLKRKYAGHQFVVIGDPSGKIRGQGNGVSCFDVLKDAGFMAIPAPTNDLDPRVGATNHFLLTMAGDMQMGYQVSKNCEHLIKALRGGYRYEKKRIAKAGDEFAMLPSKNIYSHIAEANHYGDMFYKYDFSTRMARKLEVLKQFGRDNFSSVPKYRPFDAEVGY